MVGKQLAILVDRLELKPALFSLSLLAFPGIAVHRCVSLLALLGISCFFKLAWLRIAGHRLELPAFLGYRFFLQDYIVFHSCLTISPGSAGHRWHRCLSCQGHLSWHPWASLRIAGHRIAAYLSWHRWASFVPLVSLRIAGHRSFHSPVSSKFYKGSVYRLEENVRRRLIESSRPFFSNQHFAMCFTVCTDRQTFGYF